MQFSEKQNFDFDMNYFDLKEKVIVLTGANGLIGKVISTALLEQGCKLAALDIAMLDDIDAIPNENLLSVQCDISSLISIQSAHDVIIKKFKQIDVLINLAAIDDKFITGDDVNVLTQFENYSLDRWNASLNINLTGLFLCCQVFGKTIVKNNKGSIINVASTYGLVGPDQNLYMDDSGHQAFYKSPAYPATKGAVVNFTRYLASYWGKNNVRVNTLCPGGVEANQAPWFINNYKEKTCLKRMASPNDYIGPIIFLASDASSYMTGANLIVDGGWTAI